MYLLPLVCVKPARHRHENTTRCSCNNTIRRCLNEDEKIMTTAQIHENVHKKFRKINYRKFVSAIFYATFLKYQYSELWYITRIKPQNKKQSSHCDCVFTLNLFNILAKYFLMMQKKTAFNDSIENIKLNKVMSFLKSIFWHVMSVYWSRDLTSATAHLRQCFHSSQ